MAEKLEASAAGHNSGITPELMLEHFQSILTAKRKQEQATAEYRHTRKRAEKAGMDLAALAMLETWMKKGAAEAERLLSEAMKYAQWASIPVGTQLGLFDTGAVPKPTERAQDKHREFAANSAGYDSGANGGTRDDCPFELGSPYAEAWHKGFNEGEQLAKRAAEMKPPKRAGSRKPGRRKKGEVEPMDEAA